MAKHLPIHMPDDKEEIIDNESDVSDCPTMKKKPNATQRQR